MKITLILQQARNDVKISPARAHGNRLKVSKVIIVIVIGDVVSIYLIWFSDYVF